jgi:hypothetical protein
MDKPEEIPEANINFEKNTEAFKELKQFCKDDEQFQNMVMKISLLEVIIGQVNDIFIGSVYGKDANALIQSAKASANTLGKQVLEQYIKNSKEIGELMPIPEVEELANWVENIHYNIAEQLYSEGFCNTVILPALQTVTESVIEFAKEDAQNEEGDNGN